MCIGPFAPKIPDAPALPPLPEPLPPIADSKSAKASSQETTDERRRAALALGRSGQIKTNPSGLDTVATSLKAKLGV